MITYANRASAVLYDFLKSKSFKGPFLIPANVCPVVPLTMMKAGVGFEFVDIDERHTMSESIAFKMMSKSEYEGLLFVHSYGKLFDNEVFYQKLKALNVDMELYSTGYAKYIELSYGGYGITKEPFINQVGGVVLNIRKKKR